MKKKESIKTGQEREREREREREKENRDRNLSRLADVITVVFFPYASRSTAAAFGCDSVASCVRASVWTAHCDVSDIRNDQHQR